MNQLVATLFCLLVAPPVLRSVTGRLRIRRVAWFYGAEIQEFYVVLLSILALWLALGAIQFVPVLGDFIGWPGMQTFVARWDKTDSGAGLAGLTLHLIWLATMTLGLCKYCLRWLRAARSTDTGRRAIALAAFYSASVSFELLRFCFGLEHVPNLVSLFATIVACLAGIVLLARVDLLIRAKGSRLGLFQMVSTLSTSTLVGALLERGSIHTAPLIYARSYRELTNSAPGIVVLLATSSIAGMIVIELVRPSPGRPLISKRGATVLPTRSNGSPPINRPANYARLPDPVCRPSLLVVRGDHVGRRISISRDAVTIGRAGHNTVPLRGDGKISMVHAEIRCEEGERYRILDMQSTNGTFVNGLKVRSAVLKAGDAIRVGDSILEFQLSVGA